MEIHTRKRLSIRGQDYNKKTASPSASGCQFGFRHLYFFSLFDVFDCRFVAVALAICSHSAVIDGFEDY